MNESHLIPWCGWLFEATWRASLSASFVIALVLLLQWGLKSWLTPRWRYALWLVVVLRLVLPVVPASALSVFNFFPARNAASALMRAEVPPALSPSPAAVPVPAREAAGDAPMPEPRSATGRSRQGLSPRDAAAWFWLAGFAGFLLVVMRRHRKIHSRLKVARPLNDERLKPLLEHGRTALGVRKTIEIFETDLVSIPAVFGFWRPRLLLPSSLCRGLSDRQLRLIFLHELMHVRRGDILLNWLLVFVQALHWFNPFVWFAFKRLRADRELLCDAQVLHRLGPEERHDYGLTLIKLAEQFSPVRLGPELLLAVNHQTEIKRRIIMIAKFKPTPRLVTIISALLLVALGVLTLTRAAEKARPPVGQPVPATAAAPDSEADRAKQREISERAIIALEGALEKLQAVVEGKQITLERLKLELGLSEDEARGKSVAADTETLRRLEAQRTEALADYVQLNTIYTQLSGLKRDELRKAILTSTSDQLLPGLLERYADSEQKLATLKSTLGEAHPEITQTKSLLETIDGHINARLDGIMVGLQTRVNSLKARTDAIAAEVKTAREKGLVTTEKARPYLMRERELETYLAVLESLRARLLQEKINIAIPAGR